MHTPSPHPPHPARHPRRRPLAARRPPIEPLEPRRLLTAAATPTANPDTYQLFQNETLAVPADQTSFDVTGFDSYDPRSYTLAADTTFSATTGTTGFRLTVTRSLPDGATPDTWALTFQLPQNSPGIYDQTGPPRGSYLLSVFHNSTPDYAATAEVVVRQIQFAPDGSLAHFAADFTGQTQPWGTGYTSGSIRFHYTGNLLANDTPAADNTAAPLTASLATPPAHGQVTLSPDGLFSYSPDPAFIGTDSFTYIAADGTTTSAPTTVTLHVADRDVAPTLTPGPDVTVLENAGPQTIPNWATHISPGPADESGQFLIAGFDGWWQDVLESAPQLDAATGTLTFTPRPNTIGTINLTLVLADGGPSVVPIEDQSRTTYPVTITVKPASDPPVAHPDSFVVGANRPFASPGPAVSYLLVTGGPTSRLGTGATYYFAPSPDTDFSVSYATGQRLWVTVGDHNEWAVTSGVQWSFDLLAGTNQWLQPGTLPNVSSDYNPYGTHPASFQLNFVQDALVQQNTYSATTLDLLQYQPADGVPGGMRIALDFDSHASPATDVSGSFRYNFLQAASLLDNDTTRVRRPLQARLVSAPSHGSLALRPDGTFTYTPDPGYVGDDSFVYVATDGTEDSDPATVSLSVVDRPVAEPRGQVTYSYPDADGNPVTVPLASRRVFDDANGNGAPDPGEPSVLTDLAGIYRFPLTAGHHTLRVEPSPGWAAAPGSPDSIPLDVDPNSTPPDGTLPDFVRSMTAPTVVDVVAFYTADFQSDYSDLKYAKTPESVVRDEFAYANQVFANSDTNVRINLVAVLPADGAYHDSGDLRTDLLRFSDPTDGFMDDAPANRARLRADLAVLFTSSKSTADGVIGISYVLNSSSPDPSHGYLAVSSYADSLSRADATLAHELGHSFGADHDDDNADRDLTQPPARGYHFSTPAGPYQDVMAYGGSVVVPFFSSPQFSYHGTPVGDAAHDNASVIRRNAAITASFDGSNQSPHTDPPPTDPPPTNPPTTNPPPPPTTPPSTDPPPSDPPPTTTPPVAAPPIPAPPFAIRVITVTAPRTPIKPATPVTLTATLRNTGASKFSGKTVVAFYLSEDRTLDASDLLLKRLTLTPRNVKPHATLPRARATAKPPAQWSGGTFYVLAVATPTGTPADERSTTPAAAPLKITAPPPPKKKRLHTKPLAAPFHVTRPIAESAFPSGKRNGHNNSINSLLTDPATT